MWRGWGETAGLPRLDSGQALGFGAQAPALGVSTGGEGFSISTPAKTGWNGAPGYGTVQAFGSDMEEVGPSQI